MDLITSIAKLEGNNAIMVVVYRLTKYESFCILSHPFITSIVVATFMDIVQKIHGNLNIIVSDRDPFFTIKFWTKSLSCLGT